MLRILTFSTFLALSMPAFAIYKCEADGNVTYSDTGCAKGKMIDMREKPVPADATKAGIAQANADRARQKAEQEKKEAKRLEAQRHKSEAKDDKEQKQAARSAEAKRKKCASLAMRKKWTEEDAANTTGKSAAKAKLKARRATEKYELECGK